MSLNFDEFQNIQQRLLNGGRLIFPDVFFQELTYMEQIVVLWKTKQNLLKAGDNITLHENEDGTVTISAGQGGEEESYRIEEVAPTAGNSKAYALINATTGEQSGSTIQIPTAIKGDKGDKGDTGNGIDSVTLAEELPTGNKYRIDMTDGTFYYFTAPRGAAGNPGEKGDAGFSPIAVVTPDSTGATVTITDENGTSSVHINNGEQGTPGITPDMNVNVSVGSNTGTPTATVTKSGTASQPVFTVVFDGLKGEQGIPGSGADGVGISNIALKESTAAGNTYTITLSNGQTYDFTAPVGPQSTTPGPKGDKGDPGTDGFSPIATATRTGNTVVISITDANGTTSGTVYDGVSPTITVTSITGGHQVEITTASGTERFDVMDGTNGNDGVSPTVSVTPIIGGNQVTITSASGTNTFNVMDGAQGVGVASVTYNSQDAQGGNVYDVNLTNGTVAGQITAPKGDAASGSSVTVTPASNYGREVGSITSDGNTQTLYAGLPYPDNREVLNIFTNETALGENMQVTNITCYIPETAYDVPVQLTIWSSNNEVIFTCDMNVNIYYYDNDIAIMPSNAVAEATYPSGEYIIKIPQFTSTSGVWDTTNRLSIKPLASGGGESKYIKLVGAVDSLSKSGSAYDNSGTTLSGTPSGLYGELLLNIVERKLSDSTIYEIISSNDTNNTPLTQASLLRLMWSATVTARKAVIHFSDITSLVSHDDILQNGESIKSQNHSFTSIGFDANNTERMSNGTYFVEISKNNDVYSMDIHLLGTSNLYLKDSISPYCL